MNAAHSGTVVALEDGMAVVRFERSSMCAHCGACMAAGEHEMEARVQNRLCAWNCPAASSRGRASWRT